MARELLLLALEARVCIMLRPAGRWLYENTP